MSTQPEQERVRPSKWTTLQVIQEVSQKTHMNGFPNLSVEEESVKAETLRIKSVKRNTHAGEHEAEGR